MLMLRNTVIDTAQNKKDEPYCSHMCDALRDLVPFVRFKKREKHPWKSVNFSKVAG